MRTYRGQSQSLTTLAAVGCMAYWFALSHAVAAVCGSMVDRVRRFEGAVLAVNVSLLAVSSLEVSQKVGLVLASVLTLMVLYAFNDFWDAEADRSNLRKNQALVTLYLRHRATILIVMGLAGAAAVLLGLGSGGTEAVTAGVGVMLINVGYSTLFKGVPVLDVAWCALWGGAFAAMTLAPLRLLFVVALMTAVCHVYQTLADREADAACGVATIAVHAPRLVPLTLVVLCGMLAMVVGSSGHSILALTAFAPILPYFFVENRTMGWLAVKAYFGVLWVVLLSDYHARF